MAKKRPSYVSVRRHQVNLIEGMGTSNLSLKQISERIGVSQTALKKFRDTKPPKLRSAFNRSKDYRKIYESTNRSDVREVLGIKRVFKYDYREPVLRDTVVPLPHENSKQIGRMIQNLYYENNVGAQHWSIYTYDHQLPNEIKAIKQMYLENQISAKRYIGILKIWRNDYPSDKYGRGGISDEYYSTFADIVNEDYEE